MIELRRFNRRRVLKAATVAFNKKCSTLACQVRDISDTGCRLRSAGFTSVPDTFSLSIETDGLAVDCRVVWRRSCDIGVQFTAPPKVMTPRRQQIIGAVHAAK